MKFYTIKKKNSKEIDVTLNYRTLNNIYFEIKWQEWTSLIFLKYF